MLLKKKNNSFSNRKFHFHESYATINGWQSLICKVIITVWNSPFIEYAINSNIPSTNRCCSQFMIQTEMFVNGNESGKKHNPK